MILYCQYKAEHMEKLVLQPAQEQLREFFTPELLKSLESDDAYTFSVDNGVPIACCGLVRLWPGRAIMWCFMSTMSVGNKLRLTKLIKKYVNYIGIRRLEIYVEVDAKGAHQWARMLGFKCEAPLMRKFGLTGQDNALYSRIQE